MYLTNQFYLHGGIEKMLSQKINYLIEKLDYEVMLCTSEHNNNEFVYPLSKKLRHIDLEIKYNRSKSYFHPKNILKSIQHFKKLKQVVKHEQPDIIVSVNFTPEQYLIPFIEKQIPKVKEFHSSGVTLKDNKSIVGKLKYQLFKIFGRYDSLVVLNKDERKYYPFENLKVIPNFIKLTSEKKVLKKENTILAAGRIAQVKQFDHLIKAWGLIANQYPEWEVKIFGDGDLRLENELKQLILNLNVPNIRLMGATKNLKEEMEKASIFAMTSATECFPMVLLEAQAAQMAVISYDCPNGPRNIIEHNQSGILTKHNSIEEFSSTLKTILEDGVKLKELGMGAKYNVQQFTEPEIMESWNRLFKGLNE